MDEVMCDQCEERPAMLVYRDKFNGAEHAWCRECSTRIVKPNMTYGGFELVGPADNSEARAEFARGLIHLEVNELLSSRSLSEVVDLLEGIIEIPQYVRIAAQEAADIDCEKRLAKTA